MAECAANPSDNAPAPRTSTPPTPTGSSRSHGRPFARLELARFSHTFKSPADMASTPRASPRSCTGWRRSLPP